MAQLLIRNLPDDAKEALRARASAHGHTMEAEARTILVDFVLPRDDDPVLEWLRGTDELRRVGAGVDLPEPTRHMPRPVDLA